LREESKARPKEKNSEDWGSMTRKKRADLMRDHTKALVMAQAAGTVNHLGVEKALLSQGRAFY